MSNCKCNCSNSCNIIGTAIALIFGIVTGILFYFGVFSAVVVPLTTILAFGFVTIIATAATALLLRGCESDGCLCRFKGTLLTGAIGTFISALVALAVSLTTGSVVFAIVIGLVGFFLALLLASIVCLVNCVTDCK